MTPEHPRWDEFISRLSGPEACDLHDEDSKPTLRCADGHNKTFATAILESMGGFDLPASLAYFDQMGAWCDCEIINLAERVRS